MLKEHAIGGRFLAPKKQFVTEEGWDPELHGGPWDPSKVEELDMMGEVQKGVWVSVGKKGVFDYEEYDDRSMKEQRIEHDSELQSIFGDEALDPSYLHPTFGGFQGGTWTGPFKFFT